MLNVSDQGELNKVIDTILSINTFEQKCVVIKFMLQPSRLGDHTKTIGIDQSSFTRSYFEHRCMDNIKKIYQHAGPAMLSTPEGVTDNIPNVPMKSTPVKKLISRKSLCLFTNILDVKPKTAKCRFVEVKPKRKAMKVCNSLWTNKKKPKLKGHSKINEQIKRNLHTWITRHPQVVQSPISNDCLKVMLDDQTEPQLVPKLLLQVFVRELHNTLASDPNDGGIKASRDEDGS